jgi:outer membrane protein
LKIATVDLRKAFDNYYKTIAASAANSNTVVEHRKQFNDMIANEKKREDDWHLADDAAHQMGRSPEARAASKKEADEILVAIRIQQDNISNYVTRTEIQDHDEMIEHITALTAEIRGVLETIAKKQGYTLVLDRTALTGTGYPMILYTSGDNDLTDALLKELNATAPVTPAPEPGAGFLSSSTNLRPPPATNTPGFIGPRLPTPAPTNTRTPPVSPGR